MNSSISSSETVRLPLTRLAAFLAGIAVIVAVILNIGYIVGSSSVPAERWTYDFMKLQERRLQLTAPENRIIVVAGSNGLFGFDGRLIEARTGYRHVNFGTHAGYSIAYHADRLRGKLHPGDIVVAPIEFANYSATSEHKSFQQVQNIAWIQSRYNEFPLHVIKENWFSPLELILSGVGNRIFGRHVEFDFDLVDSDPDARCGNFTNGGRDTFYDIRNSDEYCHLYAPRPPNDVAVNFHNSAGHYLLWYNGEDALDINPDIFVLKQAVEEQGAELLLTWPAMMTTIIPEQRRKMLREYLEKFHRLAGTHGIDIRCGLDNAYFEYRYFYDTEYHLNAWGATLRSERLVECLSDEMGVKIETVEPALPRTSNVVNFNATLHDAITSRVTLGHALAPFEGVYADFVQIAVALQAHRKQTGSFPKTDGWIGTGGQGRDPAGSWIPGLSPGTTEALPVDGRGPDAAAGQYRYISDGKDFKLVAQDVDDCALVIGIAPQLVDPKRRKEGDCSAYGFWSSTRAASW